jgi:hypothetical protein
MKILPKTRYTSRSIKKTILSLILLVILLYLHNFALADVFEEDFFQRLNNIGKTDDEKIELYNSPNSLTYLVFPKKPISQKGVLFTVLKSLWMSKFKDYDKTTAGWNQKEIEYLYESLKDNILYIRLYVREIYRDELGSWGLAKEVVNTLIEVPLQGTTEKEGTLSLHYEDKHGRIIQLSDKYYILLTLIKPDRISIAVKQN